MSGTRFTMTNDGEERHVMVLFRLADGATMERASSRRPCEWILVGGQPVLIVKPGTS